MQAFMLIGGAMSALGAIQQANVQAANMEAQAKIARYNATVNENNAKAAAEQASFKEDQQRRQFRQLQGQAIAGTAQSGVGFSGSPLDLLRQNEVNNELDNLVIRYEGQNQQNTFKSAAALDRMNAGIYESNAKSAITGGYLSAGAGLLSSAAQYKYYTRT
jgi:hypothetical protein